MPQMAPMWWTTLFLMFITSFILMWAIMYYQYSMKPLMSKLESIKMNPIAWKW